MKRLFLVLGAIGLIATAGATIYLLSAPSKPSDPTTVGPSDFAKIWGKKEIIVGLDEAYPPITFKDEKGEIVGFDVDLAKEAFKRMGLIPIFKPMNWDTIILSLTNKDIDIVWSGMSINEERKQKIDFTDPYFQGGYVYILKSNSPIKTKQELVGKVIGVQAGSSNETDLRKSDFFKQIRELKTYPSFEDALLDVNTGRIDAEYGDLTFAYYFINTKKMNFKMIDEIDTASAGAGVGIRKSDTALKNELNKVLSEMKKDGTAQKLSEKWFGKNFVI